MLESGISPIFCFVVQSCQQLDAEGNAKQKALQHDQNSALKLRQASGSGEASPGKHGFKKKFKLKLSIRFNSEEEKKWHHLTKCAKALV